MRRGRIALIAASVSAASLASSPLGQDQDFPRALSAYAGGDQQAIPRLLESVRGSRLMRELEAVIRRWSRDWQPVQAVFLLELAREFVTRRPDRPGTEPIIDAFELAWHKTAIAFLQNQRRPDVLVRLGTAPLRQRLAAVDRPGGPPRIIDPWFALTLGIAEEQWMQSEPWDLESSGSPPAHARNAARLFAEATAFESTRAEAFVRLASVLGRSGRAAEALDALDRFGDRTDDVTLRYWGRLFRGRALEALDRHDDAARAYRDALSLVPDAQTPAAALSALERRRGRQPDAERWAQFGRSRPAQALDPWSQYATGEYRFFSERLAALRGMAKQ